MATTDELYVTEPLIDGETIQRHYQTGYPYAAARRGQPVDFGAIPGMLALLRGLGPGPEWYEAGIEGESPVSGLLDQARRHLHDAANEALPSNVRAQHFDIAGANVWNAMDQLGAHPPALMDFMQRFRKAGGV